MQQIPHSRNNKKMPTRQKEPTMACGCKKKVVKKAAKKKVAKKKVAKKKAAKKKKK